MLRPRTAILTMVFAGLLASGYFAGLSAQQSNGLGILSGASRPGQQVMPREHVAAYSFRKDWGELKTVVLGSRGWVYFFENSEGIRVVQTSGVGPEDIEVIRR